jgi:aspartate racemase
VTRADRPRASAAMKKIGIVGGLGWLSTIDYYAEICRRSERLGSTGRRGGPGPTPEMCIESLDHVTAVSLLGIDGDDASWSRFDEYHRAALRRLERSGADVALIASNTPHHRFDAIVRGIRIPVINIFEAAAGECARRGARQVLILGTAITMSSPEIRKRFADRGIEAAGPLDEPARRSTVRLIAELQSGRFKGTGERISRLARSVFTRQFSARRPVACLACTELSLAFPKQKTLESFSKAGVTFINSSAVHAAAALAFAAAL